MRRYYFSRSRMNPILSLLIFFTSVVALFFYSVLVQGKSTEAEDGPCKEKFIETINATYRLNKTWHVVYLRPSDGHSSMYPDNTPKCGLTGHGESCVATTVTFDGIFFHVLGVNEEVKEARVVRANYTQDSDKYAILKMAYNTSWIQTQNGSSRFAELPEGDREIFNSHYALIQIDINDRFAFIGRCPDFDIAFIVVDPKYYNQFLQSYFDYNVEEGTRAGRAFNDLPMITDWIRFDKEFPTGYEKLIFPNSSSSADDPESDENCEND